MCAAVVQDRGKHKDTSGDGDEASRIQRERERSASHMFLPAAGNVINRWSRYTAVAHNDMQDAAP